MQGYVSLAVLALVAYFVYGIWRLRKKPSVPGPAAAGMMNEILSDDPPV
jgi:hypothetical protein